MAAKKFNEKRMSFKDNEGNEHGVYLFTTRTRLYTTEHACCNGKEGKYKWCNRPWQTFTYAGAMEDLITKLPKEWQENATRRLINNEEERIHKECETFLNTFKSNYNKLSDKTKEIIASHMPTIENETQAKAIGNMISFMAAVGL